MDDQNLTAFSKGDDLLVEFYARNRDQTTPMPGVTASGVFFIISEYEGGPALVTVNGPPNVALVDQPTAKFTIALPAALLAAVIAEKIYRYQIWAVSPQNQRSHQVRGVFVLRTATAPA
jgi:hypothetical protein